MGTPTTNETVTTPAQTTTEQVTPPAATPPVQEQDNASRHFAALAKRERAIQEREKAHKEREAKYADYEARDKARRDDPDALLTDYGYTLDDLIKRKANGGKLTAEQIAQKALDEMGALKKERADDLKRQDEEKKQREVQAQKDREETAVSEFKTKINAFLEEKKESYELILSQDSPIDLVYDVIDSHYENTKGADGTGRIMTFEEAANHVEKYLEAEADKFLALQKIKSKFTPKEAESPSKKDSVNPRRAFTTSKETTTLSSDLQSQSGTPAPEKEYPKDPRLAIAESRKKAAALLRWGSNT